MKTEIYKLNERAENILIKRNLLTMPDKRFVRKNIPAEYLIYAMEEYAISVIKEREKI